MEGSEEDWVGVGEEGCVSEGLMMKNHCKPSLPGASGAPEAGAGLNSVSSSSAAAAAAAAAIAKFDNSTNWTLCCRRGRRRSCPADDCLSVSGEITIRTSINYGIKKQSDLMHVPSRIAQCALKSR